jgi:flagellar biosynthesis protein FlhA
MRDLSGVDTNQDFDKRTETLMSLGLLGIMAILLIPLPSPVLDAMIAVNFAITIVLLLITLQVKHPLEFSVFPSLLLLITIFRLSLNVATTRLILLSGDAGRIVATFGGFVVGGSLVVGLVIFLILIIIQFIVITKGSNRVSEVAARFTLDALPGKQMAIDAELTSGAIDQSTAMLRRQQLTQEAEFYGAMDGASKFVRGDAIAGLVVTAVNLAGGVSLGIWQGMGLMEAVRRYSVLTVGDGLVSQIPALIIATAAGILVTKAGSKVSLGTEIRSQFSQSVRALMTGAGILAALGLVPGLPKLVFLGLAGGLVVAARLVGRQQDEETVAKQRATPPPEPPERAMFRDFILEDRLALQIGVGLYPLMNAGSGKDLMQRIQILRRDLGVKNGVWVPPVRIVDSLDLGTHTYRILIGGREVARHETRPDLLLAIDPAAKTVELAGETTTDPSFHLAARWIEPHLRTRAELAGYTVVDPGSVLITHLGEVLKAHAAELLSREDLKELLDQLKQTHPTIVEELRSDPARLGRFHVLLKNLLGESVPLTDMAGIVESFLQHVGSHSDLDSLADAVRIDLGRSVCDRYRGKDTRLNVIIIDPALEMALRDCLHEKALAVPQLNQQLLVDRLRAIQERCEEEGLEVAVLCDGNIRRAFRRLICRSLRTLHVLAYRETPSDCLLNPVDIIARTDIYPPRADGNITEELVRRPMATPRQTVAA